MALIRSFALQGHNQISGHSDVSPTTVMNHCRRCCRTRGTATTFNNDKMRNTLHTTFQVVVMHGTGTFDNNKMRTMLHTTIQVVDSASGCTARTRPERQCRIMTSCRRVQRTESLGSSGVMAERIAAFLKLYKKAILIQGVLRICRSLRCRPDHFE